MNLQRRQKLYTGSETGSVKESDIGGKGLLYQELCGYVEVPHSTYTLYFITVDGYGLLLRLSCR